MILDDDQVMILIAKDDDDDEQIWNANGWLMLLVCLIDKTIIARYPQGGIGDAGRQTSPQNKWGSTIPVVDLVEVLVTTEGILSVQLRQGVFP